VKERPEGWKVGTYRDRVHIIASGGSYCDRCHVSTWRTFEVDGDQEGNWAYCGPCASLVAAQVDRRERAKAPTCGRCGRDLIRTPRGEYRCPVHASPFVHHA